MLSKAITVVTTLAKTLHSCGLRMNESYISIVERWHDIVADYSKLELSVDTDRLPAFSGLAKRAERQRSGRYLAGLWEDSLIEDLFW
jgi:hypothetical protein